MQFLRLIVLTCMDLSVTLQSHLSVYPRHINAHKNCVRGRLVIFRSNFDQFSVIQGTNHISISSSFCALLFGTSFGQFQVKLCEFLFQWTILRNL